MKDSVRNKLIVAEQLCKTYAGPGGKLTVLDDISFSIEAGESVAVVGVSGSGKSTLLALLAGLERPSQGCVLLDGHDLNRCDEDARARLRNQLIGFVFQQFHLLPAFTALENVALPLELRGAPDATTTARDALAAVGLAARAHHRPHALSGGEQQRVALARAYCTRPKILLADEPTGNLDRDTAAATAELMFSLNAARGTTLVVVTHDEGLAYRCGRRIALAGGRLKR